MTFHEIYIAGLSSLAHSMYLNMKMSRKDNKEISKEYEEEYKRVCMSHFKLTGKEKTFYL